MFERVNLQQVEIHQRRQVGRGFRGDQRRVVHVARAGVEPATDAFADGRAIPLARFEDAVAVGDHLRPGHARAFDAGLVIHRGQVAVGMHVEVNAVGRVMLSDLLSRQLHEQRHGVGFRGEVAIPRVAENTRRRQRHFVLIEPFVAGPVVRRIDVETEEVAERLDGAAEILHLRDREPRMRPPAVGEPFRVIVAQHAGEVAGDQVVNPVTLQRRVEVLRPRAAHVERIRRKPFAVRRDRIARVGQCVGKLRRDRDQHALAQIVAPAIGQRRIDRAREQADPVAGRRRHGRVHGGEIAVIPVRQDRNEQAARAGDPRPRLAAHHEVGHLDSARVGQAGDLAECDTGRGAASA